jgi:CDP-glucose 4,6-dehydratase
VLEAISGYLFFALNLKKNKKLHGEAFNFGPNNAKNYTVVSVVKLMKKNWEKISWELDKKNKKFFYESSLLKLNCNKAKNKLKWKSILSFAETIGMVSNWYKNYYLNPSAAYKISLSQIQKYEKLLKKRLVK